MQLPFKEESPTLPNNKAYAENRLKCLEKRLTKDEQHHKDYVALMEDMIARDDATSRNQWKMAKVTEVFPGVDGKVRKLKLLLSDTTRDSKGTYTTRPFYWKGPCIH